MNIKLHTPKSLKNGSGMASLKQFLLSLFATTVSIALTFGTAAVIDYNKKQKEKREIVMMVMYDMYNSLEAVKQADSRIMESIQRQIKFAEDTTNLKTMDLVQMALIVPNAEFTETIERIFSSSIETINTVGNVLFTENVADFYRSRNDYKRFVCDSVQHAIETDMPFQTAKGTINFDYSYYAFLSSNIMPSMQALFDQCKQMMDVTDEEIEAYRKEREKIEKSSSQDEDAREKKIKEVQRLVLQLDSLQKKQD